LNYGGIGSAIGHELTHGFDDQGRKYDEFGNLRLWWTPEDIHNFYLRTVKLVDQYSAYQILNEHVNGNLTLGENLADLGGLEIAYQAFLQTKQATEGVKIDGLTPNQRFFLAFARAWRVKMTDERRLVHIKEDPHPPEITRINVPLSNMMGFYRTFNVTARDAMFRRAEDRLVIW
jgi:putative endopeptidase